MHIRSVKQYEMLLIGMLSLPQGEVRSEGRKP